MTTDPLPSPRPSRGRASKLLLAVAFAATFAAGGLTFSGATLAAETMGMAAMHGHGDMHAMMAARLDEALTAVDATPDQSAKIHEIMRRAMQSIGPVHEQLKSSHGELHRLILAPTIDRAALEQLRAADIAAVDTASRTLVGAIADAAEVLTPAQRAKLGAMMAAHQHQQ